MYAKGLLIIVKFLIAWGLVLLIPALFSSQLYIASSLAYKNLLHNSLISLFPFMQRIQ